MGQWTGGLSGSESQARSETCWTSTNSDKLWKTRIPENAAVWDGLGDKISYLLAGTIPCSQQKPIIPNRQVAVDVPYCTPKVRPALPCPTYPTRQLLGPNKWHSIFHSTSVSLTSLNNLKRVLNCLHRSCRRDGRRGGAKESREGVSFFGWEFY